MSGVKKSLQSIGLTSPNIETSAELAYITSKQLILFAGGFHASLSAQQGSEKARKMTVTSGLKCCELYQNFSPVGLLARMLLASSVWGSMIVYLTWKVKVTKSRHLLFQLAPLMPRTEETGFGLWHTPRVLMIEEEPEKF